MSVNPPHFDPRPGDAFAPTRWSLIARGRGDSTEARRALSELCELYWYPLYAFVRSRGHDHDDASDLTQGFFQALLARDDLGRVDPARGRFRAFLIASIRNFVANDRDHRNAARRGGGRPVLSLDLGDGDRRYRAEPAIDQTPERIFERRFAIELLGRTTSDLEEEWRRSGRADDFARLSPLLTPGRAADDGGYREVGEALGLSESAVKMAVHRMRRRFGELLRRQVRDIVADEEDVDDEIRQLFDALAGAPE